MEYITERPSTFDVYEKGDRLVYIYHSSRTDLDYLKGKECEVLYVDDMSPSQVCRVKFDGEFEQRSLYAWKFRKVVKVKFSLPDSLFEVD